MTKVTVSLSPYNLPNDLFMPLFKASKVEEEMVKAAGSTCPLPINPIY